MEKSRGNAAHRALAQLLRARRISAGLTQADVARELDEPQSFVSKYESGERRLDIVELRNVAVALGTDLVSLASEIDREMRHES